MWFVYIDKDLNAAINILRSEMKSLRKSNRSAALEGRERSLTH
jgi:prefoldin subunit 5